LAGVPEVAEYFGIPENTVRDQVYRGVGVGVLAFRVGRFLRWEWDDIDAWVQSQKQKEAV
jgi:hypothetical protein